MMKLMTSTGCYFFILLFIIITPFNIGAANLYVNKTTVIVSGSGWDGVDGNAYTGTPGAGRGYGTIQAAINAMSPGDKIYVRGGEYDLTAGSYYEAIHIPTSKNGSSWAEGSYNYVGSYPGEWAILDGQNNCGARGVIMGNYEADYGPSYDLKYWIFDRLEFKNARSADGAFSWALFISGGPNVVRRCYFHDNLPSTGNNNPAALAGYHWRDNLVENNYFKNNGSMTYDPGMNAAHILYFSDYRYNEWYSSAFYYDSTRPPGCRNEIRYNYFENGNIGFKHKAAQILSGRATGFQDTYANLGDKIHHNIFKNTLHSAILINQDFSQVYNNILDSCAWGLTINYEPSRPMYKVCVYNNTVIGSASGQNGFIRYSTDITGSTNPLYIYGWDYNNIFDSIVNVSHWVTPKDMTIAPTGTYDLSNYYNNCNYIYRPTSTTHVRLAQTYYSAAQFEAQTLTHSGRTMYTNVYNSSDPLYAGIIDANKYITRASHVLRGTTTVANGGVGGAHPYLAGVTIPSYIGATNPSDDDWVAGVLAMDASYFTSQTAGSDPTWIEGSGSSPSTPTIRNGSIVNGGVRP